MGKIIKKCLDCKSIFLVYASKKNKYCSKRCAYTHRTIIAMSKKKNKLCKQCNSCFIPKIKTHQFCSRSCAFNSYKGKFIKFNCDFCKKNVEKKEFNYNLSRTHFCSSKCFNNHRNKFGKKKEYHCVICKIIFKSYFKNQIFCSHQCYIQYRNDNYHLFSKEKAPNWRGGKSFELYSEQFDNRMRRKIRCRDNHCCQICGLYEPTLKKKLAVHHIDYNKQNNHPINLISLCSSCHAKTGFNRKDWEKYFNKLRMENNGN